ncbi:hypothetical protein Nepgr_025466 [Nepenthes gracilis]|uniref:Glycine-rich protein n=1 Tax=Nepenthes gracilis TaxID=150966 RepID=A0AAD3XZQ4_NEPGR|nr:hypothetical protein Nepgr_025466 [Nepenthes gracilis]
MLKHRIALWFFLSVLFLPPLAPSTAEARPLNGGSEVGSVAGRGGDKGGKVGFVGSFSFVSRKMAGPSPGDRHHRFETGEASLGGMKTSDLSGPSPGDGNK